MVSLVVRAILCLIFGFFIYETINEFNKLSGLSLNPYLAIVPSVLAYVVQEFVIKKLRANEKAVPINKPMEPKIDKAGSTKKVWWICDKGHEYQARVYNRSKGRG